MNTTLVVVFVICLFFLMYSLRLNQPMQPAPQSITNSRDLYTLLQRISSGDKITLTGSCEVNLYTKYTTPQTIKQNLTSNLNDLFRSFESVSGSSFQVQELDNVYEKIDSLGNTRYIVDATMQSKTNPFTAKVVLDIVILRGEVMINSIQLNEASNAYLINRFDTVYQDQGILMNHNSFTENVSSLLDNRYQAQKQLISMDTRRMDTKNYSLDNVISMTSVLQQYYPATLSKQSKEYYQSKGIEGSLESYFPPDQATIPSPQYCDKLSGQQCIIHRGSSTTEYNQPYMGPGLFFNRSSYPKGGY